MDMPHPDVGSIFKEKRKKGIGQKPESGDSLYCQRKPLHVVRLADHTNNTGGEWLRD